MKIKSRAPGKLILIGEYAVLKGAPALVMAVDKFATVEIEPHSNEYFRIDAPDLDISNKDFKVQEDGSIVFKEKPSELQRQHLKFFANSIQVVWNYLNKNGIQSLPITHINLDTSNFFDDNTHKKLGLGSSAALTAALIGGLLKYYLPSFDLSNKQSLILELAITAHQMAQGEIGSGVDLAASVCGGILRYQIQNHQFKQPPLIEELTLPGNLHIFPVSTGESASTKIFVEKFNQANLENSAKMKELVKQMSLSSTSAIKNIKKKEVGKFLNLTKTYYEQLKILGELCDLPIISTKHQKIAEIVYAEGAVYKPSGAGGGDFGIIFCDSKESIGKIESQLLREGFRVMPVHIDYQGIRIVIKEDYPNG